ncbi:MAG: hypothetical protein BMS9Abin23_0297 [Thermodesulfobacteriota bacterium]|nr:MAG: hypothetical protein BMS9Abin23_0297 [Thermodesulfobacteriota bacterium]
MSNLLVEFYARKDCSPCEKHGSPGDKRRCEMCVDARNVINRVNTDIPFVFREVDISISEDLFRRYRQDIPTVFINGKKAFKFKVDESEFRKKVKKELLRAGLERLGTRKDGPLL